MPKPYALIVLIIAMSTINTSGTVASTNQSAFKKSNDHLQKHLLVGSLFGAFTFTLLVILLFCLYRRRKRFRFTQILPSKTKDSHLEGSEEKNFSNGQIALFSMPNLEVAEKAYYRHSLPVTQLNRSPLLRPHSVHISSAQSYVHQKEGQYDPSENLPLGARFSLPRTSLTSFANPCIREVDPESVPIVSPWPTLKLGALTTFPSLVSDQSASLSRASSGSENVQSSDGHDRFHPQRLRPLSCAADFAGPTQSDVSISPISKKTPSSVHESILERALTSIGHGSESSNVRQNSAGSSIVWSNGVENGTNQRRSNARARVQNLSFIRAHRKAFMSLSNIEVRQKNKSDRNLTSSFSGNRRAKTSDPSMLHSATKGEFQSVSTSSTFKSNFSRSDEGHSSDQRNLHRLSNPFPLMNSASDPLLLVRSDFGTQQIVSPFEHWLNSNQNHRGSSHTINSLTGRRRSSLHLIDISTTDSSGQKGKESSYDTAQVTSGHD
jgi:hypothetical protein